MIEEFVHPKSMPTPVAAGALAVALAAAAAKSGIDGIFAAICASLFLGLIVWQSKEFKEASLSLFSKTYYYLLDSAIIFVIAVATQAQTHSFTSNTDTPNAGHTNRIALLPVAHAAERAPQDPSMEAPVLPTARPA